MRALLWAALATAMVGFCAPHCVAEEKPKLHGRLGLGNNFGGRGLPHILFEVVLKATLPTSSSTRARIEAGADQDDLEFKVKDAFLELRGNCAPHRYRAGRDRKVLGWHYDQETSDRLGIDLDPPNAFLNELAFTNRDYFVSWDWRSVEEDCEMEEAKEAGSPLHPLDVTTGTPKARAGAAAFFGQTNDYSLIGHGVIRVGSAWSLGSWLLGEARETRISSRPLIGWAGAASALYQEGPHRAELEGWLGEDPLASELARERNAPDVRFAAAVLRYAFHLRAWNPYVTASVLVQDLSRTSRTLAAAGGVRYFFQPHLSLALEARHETWRGIGHSPDETRAQLFGRYFF